MTRLEELTTLCKVIEQKSFSRAAELLELSQPAVSLQVESLEAEYGVELLHRDGFEIVPVVYPLLRPPKLYLLGSRGQSHTYSATWSFRVEQEAKSC